MIPWREASLPAVRTGTITSPSRRREAVLALALTLGAGTCADLPVPIPDEFDAAFAKGTVCMPAMAHTGTTESAGAAPIPLRFDFCRYRCIALDPGTQRIHYAWACGGGVCEMMLLATSHVQKVTSERHCDGRDLDDPPPDECTPQSVSFDINPPCCLTNETTGEPEYVSGAVRVLIPYLTLEEGDAVKQKLDTGLNLREAVESTVGVQRYPGRDFQVVFDPAHPVVSDAAALASGDCHEIPLP